MITVGLMYAFMEVLAHALTHTWTLLHTAELCQFCLVLVQLTVGADKAAIICTKPCSQKIKEAVQNGAKRYAYIRLYTTSHSD